MNGVKFIISHCTFILSYIGFCLIAHQIAALAPQVLAAEVVLDPVLLPVVHPAVRVVLQVVPEIEDESAVVVKVLMHHAGMTIRKKKEIKKGKEKGTEIEIEKEIVTRKRRKEAILFQTNLNLKDALGIFFISVDIIFSV